ncbi:hypothetical protein BTVI_01108 [Pitangus sulphuratus]|nr:hypothetical protein BTVI_01108 [Pitangus sulphuratus]
MLEQALAEVGADQKLKQTLLSGGKGAAEAPKAAPKDGKVPIISAPKAPAAEVPKAAPKDGRVPITLFPTEEINFWNSNLIVPSEPLTPTEQASASFPVPPYKPLKEPENVPLPNDDSDMEVDDPGPVQQGTVTAQDQFQLDPIMQEVWKQSKRFKDLLEEMRQQLGADQYVRDQYGGIPEEYKVMRKQGSDRYQRMQQLTDPPQSQQQTAASSVKSGNAPDRPPPPLIDPDYSPGHCWKGVIEHAILKGYTLPASITAYPVITDLQG